MRNPVAGKVQIVKSLGVKENITANVFGKFPVMGLSGIQKKTNCLSLLHKS